MKGPTVSDLTWSSCLVEWPAAKMSSTKQSSETSNDQTDFVSSDSTLLNEETNEQLQQIQSTKTNDSLEYILQVQSTRRDSDYKEVYKGTYCSYRLKDLEANTEYYIRVCAVRISPDSSVQRICSPFTSPTVFTTPKPSLNKPNPQIKTNLVDSFSTSTSNVSSNTFWSRLFSPNSLSSQINTNKTLKINRTDAVLTHQKPT